MPALRRSQAKLRPASGWRTESVIPLENGIQVKGGLGWTPFSPGWR